MWSYCKALRPSPGFNVDQPPNDDNYMAEIFAMVRDNGRILDDFSDLLQLKNHGIKKVKKSPKGRRKTNPQNHDFQYILQAHKWRTFNIFFFLSRLTNEEV
jgi:hypothetical protein